MAAIDSSSGTVGGRNAIPLPLELVYCTERVRWKPSRSSLSSLDIGGVFLFLEADKGHLIEEEPHHATRVADLRSAARSAVSVYPGKMFMGTCSI